MTFSSLDRSSQLNNLTSETFDLVIIGGGATGCGIALDAASRGMKTALIEKEDFASGTSSKSTKLIHGGLRYLKQLEFGLVRETGTERAIVHKLAPHLVLPQKMLMPITKGGTYGKLAASFGVMVYDILAGVQKDDRRKMLSKNETLTKEPLLNDSTLLGGCYYAEYRTDDARLSIELIKKAAAYGCNALNYCKAEDFVYEDGKVTAVKCQDLLSDSEIVIKGRQVVSAGGPWVDILRDVDKSKKGKRLHLTKGVHLVFDHDKIPVSDSVYFDNTDGRMLFAIPRGKITYVGTTDTTYTGDMDRVVVTRSDADYVLAAVKHAFPSIEIGYDDIKSNWAGLRPLIHEDGKSPSELSRKDEIFHSESGLISIAGGKLTGFRKMAQRIVDLVEKKLPESFDNSKTRNIPLTENGFNSADEVKTYISNLEREVTQVGLDTYHAWYLTTTYGKQSKDILSKLSSYDDAPDIALIRAELWYSVHHEMVQSLEDFYVRRTGRLYFDIDSIASTRSFVTADLITYLGWDSAQIDAEEKRLDELLFDAQHYYEEELSSKETASLNH